MALRDQPYLPLYIQDYLTDEKLNECSASTQGIYIKIMCLMHKSETYGKILLKQKYKQNESTCLDFGLQLANHLPFSEAELSNAIKELLNENVCFLDGDYLCQKRMINDNNLSIIRAEAGKKGGEKTQEKNKKFAKAKSKANTENEYEYEYVIEYLNKKTGKNFKNSTKKTQQVISARLKEGFTESDFYKVIDIKTKAWLNDEKMNEYLRPETLFGTKFESYLNSDKSIVPINSLPKFRVKHQLGLTKTYNCETLEKAKELYSKDCGVSVDEINEV